MKSSLNSKRFLIYCILFSGLIFASWYLNFNSEVDENTHIPESNSTSNAIKTIVNDDQWTAKIDHLNRDISALKNILKNHDGHHDPMIENRFNTLNREIGSLRDKLNTLMLNNPGNTATDSTEYLSNEEQEQKVKIETAQQLALYDSVAKQEGIDQKWASDAKNKIYQSFQSLTADGIGVSEVDCHSSLCKAGFYFDATDAHAAIHKLQSASPWHGETFIWISDIEQGEGTIYLARDGGGLPNFD